VAGDPGLFWTGDYPKTGWRILRNDTNEGWNGQQLGGPGQVSGASIPAVLTKIDADENMQRRRFTETQIREALAGASGVDVNDVVTRLRNVA
jgi:hypothetical protein